MDITISPSNLKRFTSSISCLGKIGKDLYLSFDPFDGLTLSSLNEAKSAFGKFHFEPGFFEKCGAATTASTGAAVRGRAGGIGEGPWRNRNVNKTASRGNHRSGSGNNHRNNDNDDDENDDTNDNDNADNKDARYVCRVPVRSIHSILRPRKGVLSLRIRSEGIDAAGNHFGLNQMKQHAAMGSDGTNSNRGRDRHGNRHRRNGGESRSRSRDCDDEEEEDDEDNHRRRRSGSFSARQRSRSRRRRKQQKRNTDEDHNDDDDDNNNEDVNGISHNTEKMMLSFEYFVECLPSKNDIHRDNHHHHHHHHNQKSNNSNSNRGGGGTFRILHKVGVTDCNGISLSESISQRRTRSEIISHPRLWLRLIDPLRRTPEMALTIDDELKVVTATSFHPMEVVQSGGVGNDNAILQAALARNAVLKTETSMGADEFDEFDFRNNRGKERKKSTSRKEHVDSDEESGDNFGEEETNEDEEDGERDRPPSDVNQKVILVFSIKEAKAMLQYCAQANSPSSYDDDLDGLGGGVIVSFHWGGKPIIIETEGDYFTAELVLATLHHGMVASNITVGGGG